MDQIIDDIISELPLKEKLSLASLKGKGVEILQYVFNLYVRSKADSQDEEYENIMKELWEHSQETHRLRIIK
jgi:hypothetical protein